jgi:hypothetical protein
LRIFGHGGRGAHDVSVVVAASPQAPGSYRARLAGSARSVRPEAPASLKTTVTLPATGYRDLVIGASSAGAAPPDGAGAGILVQAVQVTPSTS